MTGNTEPPGIPGQIQNEQQDRGEQIRRLDRVGMLVTSMPKWIAYAVIAWQARLSIEAMTGKRGIASLLERFGREASYWEVVCWSAAILGILLGVYSRHLLRRYLAHDVMRLHTLERRLNMADSSSAPMNAAAVPPVERE